MAMAFIAEINNLATYIILSVSIVASMNLTTFGGRIQTVPDFFCLLDQWVDCHR